MSSTKATYLLQQENKANKGKAELSCAPLELKYYTQHFNLRCFKSDFDAVKSKFGLLIEYFKKTTSKRRHPQK